MLNKKVDEKQENGEGKRQLSFHIYNNQIENIKKIKCEMDVKYKG